MFDSTLKMIVNNDDLLLSSNGRMVSGSLGIIPPAIVAAASSWGTVLGNDYGKGGGGGITGEGDCRVMARGRMQSWWGPMSAGESMGPLPPPPLLSL